VKTSPLPWKFNGRKIVAANGETVVELDASSNTQDVENCKLIVIAVNRSGGGEASKLKGGTRPPTLSQAEKISFGFY